MYFDMVFIKSQQFFLVNTQISNQVLWNNKYVCIESRPVYN